MFWMIWKLRSCTTLQKKDYQWLSQFLFHRYLRYLIYPTDHIRFQLDKCFYTAMVLIDLQKGFDTVDHVFFLIPEWFRVEYHRDPFWDHYYFSFMSTISCQLILYPADNCTILVLSRDLRLIEEGLVMSYLPSINGWSITGSLSI